MNYYQARPRKSDRRFHYTCMNDGKVWPAGYCAIEESACSGEGHATAEKAEDCYTRFLLDTCLRLDGFDKNQQRRCQVCGEFTQGFAEITQGTRLWILCDAHRTREHAAKLMGRIGSIASSF